MAVAAPSKVTPLPVERAQLHWTNARRGKTSGVRLSVPRNVLEREALRRKITVEALVNGFDILFMVNPDNNELQMQFVKK